MNPQRKLLIVAAIIGVLLVTGLASLLLRNKQGTGTPDTGGTASAPPSSTTRAGGTAGTVTGGTAGTTTPPPSTISADLLRPTGSDVDHRVVKPTTAPPPPKQVFTYALMAKLPEVKVTSAPVIVYREVTSAVAAQLAAAYGMKNLDPFIKGYTYSFTGDIGTTGAVVSVDGRSGFSSYSRVIPPQAAGTAVKTAAEAKAIATAELQRLGLLPEKADVATYQRTSSPGTFYVEVHRAWDPLPILESTGMLYASASDRKLNRTADADVVKTSDASDGLTRASDFNTATVTVDARGRITSVVANMRPVEKVLPARPLKTPDQAWQELQAGGGVLGFTMPSTSNLGGKTWEQVFPQNTATSDEARVREVLLAYAEKPDGERQRYLQPVYIFKGEAKLQTGVLADFIVAVPALTDDALPQ